MRWLAPVPIFLPLLVAALLVTGGSILPRRALDTMAAVTAAIVATASIVLVLRAGQGFIPVWFGGWVPRDGAAIGVALVVDPLGASVAVMAAVLVLAALVFSWRYFDTIAPFYHALMLVFLAGMAGFSLTGDLFNMFVFFELMSVAAYALTGSRIEERAPLQGALGFALVNTIGGLLILMGIALLYGRAGSLNLAQIGRVLAEGPADGLVVMSFTFLVGGFLVKAAIVPFHFWLSDAYAAVPTPVGVVFAGILSEMGLLGVARVYWTAFAGTVAPEAIRGTLLALGALTAVVGSIMAFEQRHLKRMLAFATVAHSGLILIGFAILDPAGAAGAGIYLVADGLVKASLFASLGIIKHRLGRLDEDDIRGRGKRLPFTGVAVLLGGLALAGLPPFGTALGKSLMEHAAEHAHLWWAPLLFGFAAVVTGGAVLRAAGRVFMGWGPREVEETPAEKVEEEEGPETRGARGRTPVSMGAVAALLLGGALAVGLWPGLGSSVERTTAVVQDRQRYAAAVLGGTAPAVEAPVTEEGSPLSGLLFAAGAAGLGAVALFRRRVPRRARRAVSLSFRPLLSGLRVAHSGEVQDYVVWLTVGVAGLGGAFAAALT